MLNHELNHPIHRAFLGYVQLVERAAPGLGGHGDVEGRPVRVDAADVAAVAGHRLVGFVP